jgi:diaminopimelate decarboxylase
MNEPRPAPVHAPMNQFAVEGQQLLVGGIALSRLAARAGGTPFFAYDRSLLDARVTELRSALPYGVELHYAIKSNPMPALVQHLAGQVDGLDVASAGELTIALNAGCAPDNISFAGPGKSRDELRQAIAAGVLLNIESLREVRELADLSAATGWPARVAVRVNPDFELKSSGMRMGGGAKQFGVDAEAVPALLREISRLGLAFEGFHIFAGSQNLRAEAIVEAQRLSFELALRLAEHAPVTPRMLNLGGGFGIPYFPGDSRLDLGPVGENLSGLVDEAASRMPGARLALELGRYLVGEAGIYVCRVIDRKASRGQTFLICDGGLNHHLAASGNFGQVLRKNFPVAIGNRMNTPNAEPVSVVGPLCTPLDLLADRMPLPEAVPGDFVVVFQSGAYGASASPQAFLGHPAPREILV